MKDLYEKLYETLKSGGILLDIPYDIVQSDNEPVRLEARAGPQIVHSKFFPPVSFLKPRNAEEVEYPSECDESQDPEHEESKGILDSQP